MARSRQKKTDSGDVNDESAKYPINVRVSREVAKMVRLIANARAVNEGRDVPDGEIVDQFCKAPLSGAYQDTLKAEQRQ